MGKMTEKQKLWRAFATWIKLRDSNDGYGECISCNKLVMYPDPDGGAHAGHLFPRSSTYNSLWFHPMNVHLQCLHCNTFLEGNTMKYREGLIRRYGEGVIEELELARAAGQTRKWYDHDYKEMAKDYRAKVKQLKKERGIK